MLGSESKSRDRAKLGEGINAECPPPRTLANGDGQALRDRYVIVPSVRTINYNDLWKNNGDGTFTNIATTVGAAGLGSCDRLESDRLRSNVANAIFKKDDRGCGAIDYDRDAQLDIFVTGTFQTGAPCRDGNQLYHNDGSGSQFTDNGTESALLRELVDNRTAAWADFDGDGWMDVSDAICLLQYLFMGGGMSCQRPVPGGGWTVGCLESADSNNDGAIDCSDAIYNFNYLFLGGEAPPSPGPPSNPCGPDSDPAESAGDLGCEFYTRC